MRNLTGIILAGGIGTRMQSELPKVLHQVCGKPMLRYMLDALKQLQVKRNIVVVGYKAELVKQALRDAKNIKTVQQTEPLGSADAVKQTKAVISKADKDLLIVYGDTPLISYQSLEQLIQSHQKNGASCTILTAILNNPAGFGRILRGQKGRIVKIIEDQEVDAYEKTIQEINVGAYCFRTRELFAALDQIKPDNTKKEYYLTDVIEILSKKKSKIGSVSTQAEQEAFGINSRQDLARACYLMNRRNLETLLSQGVTIVDPSTTYIYAEVEAGRDTVILPHSIIEGKVKIGQACRIGPFAHLRSGTVLDDGVQIGNFVEVVRSRVGSGSKIKHHSYIGDTTIGKGVNIGAGTIIANYDGKQKCPTVIEDQAFIGTGTILIAPVRVGQRAVTGAGSVVTKGQDVPPGATVVGVPARILKKK